MVDTGLSITRAISRIALVVSVTLLVFIFVLVGFILGSCSSQFLIPQWSDEPIAQDVQDCVTIIQD